LGIAWIVPTQPAGASKSRGMPPSTARPEWAYIYNHILYQDILVGVTCSPGQSLWFLGADLAGAADDSDEGDGEEHLQHHPLLIRSIITRQLPVS
jgi:hypothetical protein